MKKAIFTLIIFAVVATFGWACVEDDGPGGTTNIYNSGGSGGKGGAGGAGGSGGLGGTGGSAISAAQAVSNANASVTAQITATGTGTASSSSGGNTFSTSTKVNAKRELAGIPTSGGPAEARFREDNRYEADWRVQSVGYVLNRQRVWPLEEGKKLSANLNTSKMHKNLLRVMNEKTTMLEFTNAPPQPIDSNDMVIFLGWIPMSPDLKRGGLIAWLSNDGATDLTIYNMVGNTVVSACEAGATQLVPVKDGYIRGGHSEVDFLGIAGGGSSVFEDGTKRAGGVSGSIGPSTTTMDAWDIDRPYSVVEAYCRLSDVKRKPIVLDPVAEQADAKKREQERIAAEAEAARKAEENRLTAERDKIAADLKKLEDALNKVKKP